MESSILEGDLRVGDYVVRPLLKSIRPAEAGARSEQTLPDKAMAVLVYLAQHSRQVCDRNDILDAVWGDDREAYDRVLDNAIREIRRALNDDARDPRYIQTIPKRGYRLLVHVESRLLRLERITESAVVAPSEVSSILASEAAPAQSAALPAELPGEPTSPGRRLRFRFGTALISLLILAALATWIAAATQPGQTVKVSIEPGSSDLPPGLPTSIESLLFRDHPCGEKNLLRPPRFLGSPDLEIRLSTRSEADRSVVEATLSSAHRSAGEVNRSMTTMAFPEGGAPGPSATQTFDQALESILDESVCITDGLPHRSRACHCLAAAQTYNVIEDPSRHIENLQRAIEFDPQLIPAYEALARAFGSTGDSHSQKAALETGLLRIEDPNSDTALTLRRDLAEAHQDFASEYQLIARLRERQPENLNWQVAEARFRGLHFRDCESALDTLMPLLDSEPDFGFVHLAATEALWICRRQTQTFEILKDRVRIFPREAAIQHRLAVSLLLAGRPDEAYEVANELLALSPRSTGTFWSLGMISMFRGDLATAESWFRQAEPYLRWPIDLARNHVGLARVALLRGEPETCSELFPPIESEGAESVGHEWEQLSHWALGRCLIEEGKLEAARRVLRHMQNLQKARSTHWQGAYVLHLESQIRSRESASEPQALHDAAELMMRALANKPLDYAYFATEAAAAQEHAGNTEVAIRLYHAALDTSPTNPWTHCRLGLLHQRLGHEEEALAHLRPGVDVFGNAPEVSLGRLCASALASLESNR